MKPQVKSSEKSRILSTKDYSIFEFPDFKISKKHLQKVKDSIDEKNLLPDYPILVLPDTYKIIEGRYRFLACYDLQLPIFYKIAEVTTEKDAISIKHIHKNIALEDVTAIYSDLKPYNDILLMRDSFDGYFTIKIIYYAIDTALATKYQYGGDCHGSFYGRRLNRLAIDSGELEQWNFNKTKARLLRMKNFFERYSHYGWGINDAFRFVNENPIPFDGVEDWCLKHAQEYQIHYAKRRKELPDKRTFEKISIHQAYGMLEYCLESRKEGKKVSNFDEPILQKLEGYETTYSTKR